MLCAGSGNAVPRVGAGVQTGGCSGGGGVSSGVRQWWWLVVVAAAPCAVTVMRATCT